MFSYTKLGARAEVEKSACVDGAAEQGKLIGRHGEEIGGGDGVVRWKKSGVEPLNKIAGEGERMLLLFPAEKDARKNEGKSGRI